MVNWKSKKIGDLLLLANGVVLLALVNIMASVFIFRIDLTEEKRYSIKKQTREMLESLDDNVFIEVYLEGELNAGFRRFQKSIRETLDEFRIYSKNKIQYAFVDPGLATGDKARGEFMAELASKGIQPTNVIDNTHDQVVEKLIFPGAVISYRNTERGVMLLKGNKASSPEEEINQSIEGIEFEFANAIYKLANDNPKRIGIIRGHGEPDSLQTASFTNAILEVYNARRLSLENKDLDQYDALVITKPATPFSPADKYRLDQYVMGGGNLLLLMDKLEATMDSASRADYFAFPYAQNLDDLLFKYGVRINMDLVQDLNASRTPIVTGQQSTGQPRIQLLEWPFFPLINHYADHPITRNLDAVVTRFASSMDTVKAEGVKKTPLLLTSQYSRKVTAPVNVSVNFLRNTLTRESFSSPSIPVSYLLEGKFTSLFKNRFAPEGVDASSFREIGVPAKIIVVADGDLAVNMVNPRTRQPMPLGYDRAANRNYANEELLMNMLAWLTDENGLINARNREIRIRPLDKERIASEKTKWQVINLALPVLVLIIFGSVRSYLRKKRFANF